jgi:hypothetical protein
VVRSAGFSLVLSAGVFLFLKGRKKEAVAVVGVTALIAVLWSVRNTALTGEGSRYMQVLLQANPYDPDKGSVTFSGLVNRVLVNAGGYLGGLLPATVLPTLVKPAPPGAVGGLNILASMLVMVVVLLGGYSLRKEGLLTNIYMLLYFAVYLLWPEVWKSERFMVPLAPLLAIYLVSGLRTILAYFGVKRVAVLAVCALLVATNLFTISRYARRQRGYTAGWVRYLETAQWAGANTNPAAIVMCRKPFLFHLFSSRRTIGYPFTRDHNTMREYLYEARPDFVVLDDFGGGSVTDIYVVPVLEEMPDYLSIAYESEDPVNRLVRLRLPDGTGR